MIRDPEIILLDEATSALDNISEFIVQKAMRELRRGRTTFIVAHRLSTIRDADRIVVMKDGRAAEVGTFEELMSRKGAFYELKQLQEI
ncbi:Heterocyst differentiation ATP-binding protein HepA [compost metagenome]